MTADSNSFYSLPLLQDALDAAFANNAPFLADKLVARGCCAVSDQFPGAGPGVVGKQLAIPMFGLLPEFQDLADGAAGTTSDLSSTAALVTVNRSYLGSPMTTWARSLPNVKDPYTVFSEQAAQRARQKMAKELIKVLVSTTGVPVLDKYTTPTKMDYDAFLTASQLGFGDRQESICCVIVPSKVEADLNAMKSTTGDYILGNTKLKDLLLVSDIPDLTVTGTMSAITPAGTTPPTVTTANTSNRLINLRVVPILGGALGTAKIKYSTDGGVTWVLQHGGADIVTAAGIPIYDSGVWERSGSKLQEATGITITFAAGTAALDNVWTATSTNKYTTAIVTRGAAAFWYAGSLMQVEMFREPNKDTTTASLNMYWGATRFPRTSGLDRPGVTLIQSI